MKIVNHYFTPCEFFKPVLIGGFLLKSERQQVCSCLQALGYLNSAVVWMVSISPLKPIFSSLLYQTLGTWSKVPTTISLIVTFFFHVFSALWQDPDIRLSFCFLLFLLDGPWYDKLLLLLLLLLLAVVVVVIVVVTSIFPHVLNSGYSLS